MSFTGLENCGNSPKNSFVAEFEEHLFSADERSLAEVVAPDCVLEIVTADGVATHAGASAVLAALLALSVDGRLVSGHLEAAITHGKAGAAWGTWELTDGAVRHFSHTMWFTTLKAQTFSHLRLFGH